VAIVFVVVTYGLADEARVRIDAGLEADMWVGPVRTVGFRATIVRLSGLADIGVPDGTCAHLFGRANGVTVLRTGGRVVRAPTDLVEMRSSDCVVPAR
jgi:hypothetical protein